MSFQSPLHFLGNRKIEQFDKAMFYKLRLEEMMAQNKKAEIPLNIHERINQKVEISKSFAPLLTEGRHHLIVYNNKLLLNFLEKGDLSFFEHPEAWADFSDKEFYNWVIPIFTKQLGERVLHFVKIGGFQSIRNIKIINQSEFQLGFSDKEKAYTLAKRFIQEKFRFSDFRDYRFLQINKKTVYLSAIFHNFFRIDFFNVLKSLPGDIFYPLLRKYIGLAEEYILAVFEDKSTLKKLEPTALRALDQAKKICQYDSENPRVKQFLKKVPNYNRKGESSIDFRSGCITIKFIFLIITAMIRLGNCNQSQQAASTQHDYLKELGLGQSSVDRELEEKISQIYNNSRKRIYGVWKADFQKVEDSLAFSCLLDFRIAGWATIKLTVKNQQDEDLCFFQRTGPWGTINTAKNKIDSIPKIGIRLIGKRYFETFSEIDKRERTVIDRVIYTFENRVIIDTYIDSIEKITTSDSLVFKDIKWTFLHND